jgi:hypothetical protein
VNSAAAAGREPHPLAAIRRVLLGTLLFGVAGMALELLLIGHVEGPLQYVPVVLLGIGLIALAWHALAPGAVTVRVVQVTMTLFVISGVCGVALHFRGNAQFELEMYPALEGTELIRETLTGATPVLAPGSMALLGLVGLAYTYRHPSLRNRSALSTQEMTQ